MTLLSVSVFLFWFQLVMLVSLVFFSFRIYRHHHLYHMKFFASPIPVRHVCLIALSLGMLLTSSLFFVTKEAGRQVGVTHMDALLLRY